MGCHSSALTPVLAAQQSDSALSRSDSALSRSDSALSRSDSALSQSDSALSQSAWSEGLGMVPRDSSCTCSASSRA
jgi:hypothetical protein